MRHKSEDDAPDRKASQVGVLTLVDGVEDEHLVQVQDHPEWWRSAMMHTNLPWEVAEHKGGDYRDQHQSESLLPPSSPAAEDRITSSQELTEIFSSSPRGRYGH